MLNNARRVLNVGNSLLVSIPKSLTKEKNLKAGDLVNIEITKVRIKLEEVKEKSQQEKLPTPSKVKK